jgi:lipid-binding SYLF domain-containing protein
MLCEVIMFKSVTAGTALTLALTALGLAGCASHATRGETEERVDAARTTLSNFMRDPDLTWFRAHVGEARAVMISPRILQAGLIVGGSGGAALVIAHDRSGTGWNGPAFYRMATGSFGLQAGAQASEMVALIMTDKALNSLLSTSFKIGGDVSVAAGPIGVGAAAPVTADMIVYTRSKGLYGGVNMDGTVITVDQGRNEAYYGRAATPVDILVTHSVSNPYGASLARMVSHAVAEGR